MTCPSCGHANDPGNRFCEYCGARLDPSMIQEATVQQIGPPSFGTDASYDAPTMFVPTDHQDSATPVQESPTPNQGAASEGTKNVICGVCGYANQPNDRFCDQCGASLSTSAGAGATEAVPFEAAPAHAFDSDQTVIGSMPQSNPSQPIDAEAPTPAGGTSVGAAPATIQPTAPDPLLAEMVMSGVPDDESPTVPTPLEGQPASAAAPVEATPPAELASVPAAESPTEPASGAASQNPANDPIAERAALETTLQEQRDNLAMFEQMASRYKDRAMPGHITTGLDESREALAEAEQKLQAFDEAQTASAQPDPAELERLNTLIQEQRDNLAMFEQMATRYQGRTMPPHISVGLDESREALAAAEAELAALQGDATSAISTVPDAGLGSAAATAMPTPDADTSSVTSAPVQAAAPAEAAIVSAAPEPSVVAAHTEAAPPMAAPMPMGNAPVPPPTPMPASPPPAVAPAPMPVLKPRLMIDTSGASVELPAVKNIIVVGREDPISGIFPEVDLTPHGGESGGVSRQHARLLHDNDSWKVEDLNSTNNTKINGTKLAPNTPTDLNDGDKLNFGRVALTFHKG